MIDVENIVGDLKGAGGDFFVGVPDSLLKCNCAHPLLAMMFGSNCCCVRAARSKSDINDIVHFS